MKIHNTLNRQQEVTQFTPIIPGKVKMYSCGPTVYDHIHIGNLRAFIVADTLRRTLKAQNFEVEHVMNFTDVDDKTILRSQERYPEDEPSAALKKLTTEYELVFVDDMKTIGNDIDAIEFVRATESIEAMQEMIRSLHKQGFAYITEDGVYFSIKAYQDAGHQYGQLLKLNTHQNSASRIDNDEYDKESANDFALWKIQKSNEPAWDFEIDGKDMKGRPGWHIECSAMSKKVLGQPFDIHTGGIDLIFPHHENEIAQSTASQPEEYARYFVHNEHLLVDGKKMSKSLNNFFTLRDIKDKGYDPLAFRLLVLQSHYRKQMNFSWDALEAAQNRLSNLRAYADLRFQLTSEATKFRLDLTEVVDDIVNDLANDMNTPEALEKLNRLTNQVSKNTVLHESEYDEFVKSLKSIDTLLGLNLLSSIDAKTDQTISDLLNKRQEARDKNDWDESDKLRDKLKEQGIAVRDTRYGQIWSRLFN